MGKILATFLVLTICAALRAQTPASLPPATPKLLTVEGQVQVLPHDGTDWLMAGTNQPLHFGDYLRTGPRSRATVRLSPLTVLRMNELTTLLLQPPAAPGKSPTLNVREGETYFFGRDRPAEMNFQTPLVSGAIRGTEFNLAVAHDGRTVVSLIDGQVALSNPLGHVEMTSGEQGIAEAGKAPVKSPMLEAINTIQWCLYYPGVLDSDELNLSSQEREDLSASLAAYRAGDLLQAVALYPAHRSAGSAEEKVYRAATLLSVGQVEQAQSLLAGLTSGGEQTNRPARLATALDEVIAVVGNQPAVRPIQPHLATEWLAESYYLQAHSRLPQALQAAKNAVAAAPDFGFAWARLAELQLSFGRLPQALEALDESLELSSRNAQSFALRGFIELAQGRDHIARVSFDQAIALDGALGNAWLGRGLCEIWQGHTGACRDDIQVAAVLEPQRALFRSYLGKAFSAAGDSRRAIKELDLARQLDPNDPTAWLYRALVEQKDNQVNQAVRDLEKSQKLNDNQSLFRSRLLLDQDQAVRGANLARVYQDTGIYTWDKDVETSDWSVREASRAVNYDYANFSAHEFLADSYDALRDPNQINLRYETAWFDELFMSDLLSPVASGNFSDFSSQRQYARLFDQNHFGASSDTEYLSRGDWLERVSDYGNYDDVAYAVDDEYRSQDGWRVNNDVQENTVSAKFKFQLTPQDSVFLEVIDYVSAYGDLSQYYNQYGNLSVQPTPATQYRGNEWQEPDLYLGYHRQWVPGVHTLFLGGYLNDTLDYNDPGAVGLLALDGGAAGLETNNFPTTYNRHYHALSAELQQVFETERQTMVVGGRYQDGWITSSADEQYNTPFGSETFSQQNFQNSLQRYNVYGYETVKVFDPLQLTAGVAYDHLRYPADIENAPIANTESSIGQFSPKAGFVWTITPETFFRFAYTRSLGGLSYDNSVRLEPTEVAGFNQAFRSIIPESVVGIVPGSRFTTYGVGLDRSFKSNTYFTIQGQILDSDGNRSVGVFNSGIFPVPVGVTTVPQTLGYSEESLAAALTQLIGDQWSAGARYELSHAELDENFPGVPSAAQDLSGRLQQLSLFLNYYHPSGFFGQLQAVWTDQVNHDYSPPLSESDFWQFNAYVGYRFWHRAAEFRIGVLNIANRDYVLNPLNLYYDLPRSRTLSVSLKFYF
jgi:tetratricopeptide (TPR) repeat protein